MSELCRFRGAVIYIYFDEHNPPHFHVRHGGRDVQIGIDPVRLLEGSLPAHIRRLILRWAEVRQAELAEAWCRAQRRRPPGKIAPLD